MIQYLKRRYAMSDEGAHGLLISILTHTLVNLSYFLPAAYALYFIKRNMETGDPGRVWLYILVSLVILVLMFWIGRLDYQKLYTKMYSESAKMRIGLAEKLKQLPLSFFDQKDVSDLSTTIMDDVTEFETLFSHAVPQLYASFLNFILVSIMLFVFDWRMGLATIWVVPLSLLVSQMAKRRQKDQSQKMYLEKRAVDEIIQEGFEQVQEILAYNREQDYLQRVDEAFEAYEKRQIRAETMLGTLINLAYALLRLGIPSVVLVGAYLYFNQKLELFVYLAFILISARIYRPIEGVVDFLAALKVLDVRVERMREMNALPVQTGTRAFEPKGYDIVFDHVTFGYEEGKTTLEKISFTAKQGEVTALVGPSGGGKTTVTKLAARFWDPDSGTITLGGIDISKIEPEELLKSFSIVFQDVALFDASVKDNIRLGKKAATDEEVLAAAKIARCDDFVQHLPEGYETMIGENGARLSGGERQRISIARAILKDAPIILLDEATASVDVENESKIQEAISHLVKDKTVLVIAHRMRTVAGVDRVLVLADGRLVEEGRPSDLMKQDGLFAAMVKRQQLA